MSDHDLLLSIHAKLDDLAESFSAHLGEHRQLRRSGTSILSLVSAAVAVASAAAAVAALWLR